MPSWLTLSEGPEPDAADAVVATADPTVIRGVLTLLARRLGLRPERRRRRGRADGRVTDAAVPRDRRGEAR